MSKEAETEGDPLVDQSSRAPSQDHAQNSPGSTSGRPVAAESAEASWFLSWSYRFKNFCQTSNSVASTAECLFSKTLKALI